ncbi:hypothetical protein [Corynebacterium accolens]|uniref:hypothetical protein n=1 Tax=Corynebacterium accolens TaxID=38284 RepID=UPI00254E4631|nr:hypothetical protein [Corynebacterium accolens]MDK8469820.1 hypothetical protein [Corynebacterium accolens]
MGEEQAGSGETQDPQPQEEDQLLDGPYGPYSPHPGAYGQDDPGGGPYDPETGLRDWYAPAAHEAQKPVGQQKLKWVDVLSAWPAIECDLHEKYSVDVESGVLRERTWRWLEMRILSLINSPSRLRTALNLTSEMTSK